MSMTIEPSAQDLAKVAVGNSFVLTRDVDRFPHFVAREGALGTITDITDGIVSLRMAEHLPGAEEWDNEVVFAREDDHPQARSGAFALLAAARPA